MERVMRLTALVDPIAPCSTTPKYGWKANFALESKLLTDYRLW